MGSQFAGEGFRKALESRAIAYSASAITEKVKLGVVPPRVQRTRSRSENG